MNAPRIPATLAQLATPIDGLRHYGHNPRRGNVDLIAESLTQHGQYRPIVARTGTFEVLAGNHTLAAARVLGWEEIAVVFVTVDDDEAARIVLADNRTADFGTYDKDALAQLLQSLPDLTGTGYDATDLDTMLTGGAPGSADLTDTPDEDTYKPQWAITVVVAGPDEQRALLEELTAEGLECKAVTV